MTFCVSVLSCACMHVCLTTSDPEARLCSEHDEMLGSSSWRKGRGWQEAVGLGAVTVGIAAGEDRLLQSPGLQGQRPGIAVCDCQRPPVLIPGWDWAGCAVGVYASAAGVCLGSSKSTFLRLPRPVRPGALAPCASLTLRHTCGPGLGGGNRSI